MNGEWKRKELGEGGEGVRDWKIEQVLSEDYRYFFFLCFKFFVYFLFVILVYCFLNECLVQIDMDIFIVYYLLIIIEGELCFIIWLF